MYLYTDYFELCSTIKLRVDSRWPTLKNCQLLWMHKLWVLAQLLYQHNRIYGHFSQSKMVLHLPFRYPFGVLTLRISTYCVRTITWLLSISNGLHTGIITFFVIFVKLLSSKILWLSFRIIRSAIHRGRDYMLYQLLGGSFGVWDCFGFFYKFYLAPTTWKAED